MADKIFNTRILNKIDTLENWEKSTLKLKKGEIAIATVAANAGTGLTEPVCMIKIGTEEEKTFSELPWSFYSKASDVAGWAKAANKPTYAANEITGISDYIADYVQTEMGISVDTDTQYQIVKVDDYNYKLQSKGKADGAWADVEGSAIVIPNDTAAIEALQGLVGTTAVATQITDAIDGLNLGNTYDAKGAAAQALTDANEYTDGKNTAMNTRVEALEAKFDGGEGSVESQIAAAVADVQNAVDALAQTHEQDKNTLESSIHNAQSAADGAQGAVTDLAGKIGDVPSDTTVVDMINDSIYDDTEVKDSITTLNELVGTISVPAQISVAVAEEADRAKAAEKANADAIDAIEADYLKAADKTALQGNIDTLAGRVTANETAIGTLNGNTSVEGSVDKKIADAINKFATDISDDDTVNTYKELIDYAASHGSEFTTLVGEVDANTAAIATLNGDVNTVGSVDKKIADAAVDVNESIATLEEGLTAAEEDITALSELVGTTSVATQITDAVAKEAEIARAAESANAAAAADAQGAADKANTDIAALHTIAKTGNVNDLVQTEGDVLIFDCGTSV